MIFPEATCDETGMLDIPYGEGRSLLRGAVYKYRCNTGVEMEGSNTLVCDGDSWNGTVPHCNGKDILSIDIDMIISS